MEEDLSIIAKKHVLQGFQNSEDILSRVSALEGHLNDVFCSRQPSTRDYDNRIDLIRILNEISKEIYGKDNECPIVEGFGSFFMDMFSAKSDLDLSINFNDKNVEARRDVKIKALRKFANKFYSLQKKKHVTNVQAILSARVPVLKVTDCGTGIECDLSVGNKDAIAKSHIILIISSIDERFRKLCFLLKAWAKAHDINSSKDGTLNSLSLVLLAAFHLQSQEPPILPPFSALFKDGIDPEVVKINIPTFLNYGNENKESIASLFVSLLIRLESVETLWGMGLCASTYEGSWIYKTWNTKKGDRNGFISIEDFTNRSENTARAVRITTVTKIFTCIRDSIQHIRSFTSGKIDAETLMSRLFGTDALTVNNSINGIAHPTPTQQPNLQDSTQGKRKRSKEKREKKQSKKKKNKSLNSWIQTHAPPHLNPLQTNSVGLGNEGIDAEISRRSKKKPDNSSIDGVEAQPPVHSNPPAESSVGLRNEEINADVFRFSMNPGSSSMGGVQVHAPPHVNHPLHTNPPVRSLVGVRNERSRAEISKYSKKPDSSSIGGLQAHASSHLNPPFHTNSLVQNSVGRRIEESRAGVLRFPKKPGNGGVQVHASPHLNPPLQTKSPVQSSVGLRNEGIYAEMWRSSKKPESSSISGVQGYAPPHLGPPLHSTPPLQSSMGFKNERSHAEIWRYPQNHTPPHLNPSLHSNPPLQSSVGYRNHAENRIHPTPNHHEGHHSRSGNAMPYNPTPRVPHPAPYIPNLGFERAYNASQSLPFDRDNRNFREFGPYHTSMGTNHQPNPRDANGAYPPPFIYRAP